MSEVLAVEFDYGVKDYTAYVLHLMSARSTKRRRSFLLRLFNPAAMVAVGVVLLYRASNFDMRWWPFAIYFAAVGAYTLYVTLWQPAASKRRLMTHLLQEHNRALFGPIRIELRDDALWQSSAMSEGWIKWPGIESVEHDAEHAYIGSSAAYVIPRRAFADQASYDRFIARATELWRNAQKD